jgi:hypothetical protein
MGSKSINVPATCVVEIKPQWGQYYTDIVVHKNGRFAPETQGRIFRLGYNRDLKRIVEQNEEFLAKRLDWVMGDMPQEKKDEDE